MASGRRAAMLGAKVGLVESGRLGGTCVNVGCVPKKVMWTAATINEFIHDAKDYGFKLGDVAFDWATIKKARDEYILRLNKIYETNMDKEKVKPVIVIVKIIFFYFFPSRSRTSRAPPSSPAPTRSTWTARSTRPTTC